MRRTRLNPRSKKGDAYQKEFEAMKPLVKERSFGLCESWVFVSANCSEEIQDIYHASPIAGTCRFRNPVHVHHRKYRKRGGTNSLSNLVHLCEPCHSWIHAHGGFDGLANRLRLALSAGESEEL